MAFHNGVFGMFEDPRFEDGTRKFMAQLKRMKDAGLEVYVGGGEGGTALARYGRLEDVTHCFTAGGTVLNALGSEPIPYLVALAMQRLAEATRLDPAFAHGVNTLRGAVTHPAVAEALGVDAVELAEAIGEASTG